MYDTVYGLRSNLIGSATKSPNDIPIRKSPRGDGFLLGIFGISNGKLSDYFSIGLNFRGLHRKGKPPLTLHNPAELDNFPSGNKPGAAGIAATSPVAGRFEHSSARNALAHPNSDGREICQPAGMVLKFDVLDDRRW